MAKLMAFETPYGTVNIATRRGAAGVTAVGVVDDTIEKAGRSLDEMLTIVTGFSEAVRAALARAEHPPAEASVEFGLEISGKGTIYVVETEATASIKVTLTYKL
jgi:hypothetical protein